MIALKTIQASFTPNKHTLFYTTGRLAKAKKPIILTLCTKSDDDSNSEASQPEGDAQKQEILARIAMLQAQKVRLTDYLDERSDYLTQFAEQASAGIDKIGEDALKEIEEANARLTAKMESAMQAFEESAELNRQETEQNQRKLEEFEDQIMKDRNEGMFFKNLGQQKKPVEIAIATEAMEKTKEINKESAGSKTRRNIYLALIGLVVTGIADSFISSPDWRKVAVLGAILVALLTQFNYEQTMLSETEKTEKERSEEEKK